jgi:glucokinase
MVSESDQGRAASALAMMDGSAPNAIERTVLADVGGTNVRFAILTEGQLGPIEHMAVCGHASFADALAKFLARQTDRAVTRRALFGVAGVVKGDRCSLTNNSWVVDAAELRAHFGFTDVHIINDFEAIAWSLPHLTSDDISKIGGREPTVGAPMVVLGPGTGLGMAAYVPHAKGALVLHSEGGHATIPSGSLREDSIIENLRQQFAHVSAERVLSGHGLENIYRAIASIDARTVPERGAAEITQAALDGSCTTSRAALDAFCAMLGDVAGNFALSFGAEGGVYIAGGIASHIHDFLPRSPFRTRFDSKGPMRRYVEAIPVYQVLHEDPAFIGLRSLALQRSLKS